MKIIPSILLGLAATTLLPLAATAAEQSWTNQIATNRFTLSGRVGFNISAKFQRPSTLGGWPGGLAPTRFTPEGDAYNYDDGYLLTDVSGNAGGMTWYWGYDNSASQISGNNILLSRSTPTGTGEGNGKVSDDPYPGVELAYNRLITVKGNARFGIEAAANYMPLFLKNRASYLDTVSRQTDEFSFTPGATPPAATPSTPYQGSYNGPAFVVGDTPANSTTVLVPNVPIVDNQKFDAHLVGFRLGPYLDWPLSERWMISGSGGLAIGLLQSRTEWNLSVGGAPSGGRGDDFDVLWGLYGGANVSYQMSERWSITGGGQFQTLGKHKETVASRRVEIDFTKSIFVSLGVNYRF